MARETVPPGKLAHDTAKEIAEKNHTVVIVTPTDSRGNLIRDDQVIYNPDELPIQHPPPATGGTITIEIDLNNVPDQ